MKYRRLGKTGWEVSEVSLGSWQVGGKWGEPFSFETAEKTLNAAIDMGVNFIDTADAYGGGKSEQAVAKVAKSRSEEIRIATKCGRKLDPHVAGGYNREKIVQFAEDSLKNMGVEAIDLLQLHCPPPEVYYKPEVFEALEELKGAGKIRHYGVSVEKVEEAIKASEFAGLATVQLIFNMFRQRPSELLFDLLKKRNVGIVVRVPLASGLLAGKLTRDSQFASGDHRTFNRNGEAFDKGETFAGVEYNTGVDAAEAIGRALPSDATMAQYALRWVLMFDAVSCVIPGASRPEQARDNAAASDLPPLSDELMGKIREVYAERIGPQVHQRW